MNPRITDILEWLRRRVNAATARGLVVGVSGGVDSALVLRLCQMAMPEQTLAVTLPCGSDPRDEADARLVATHFDVPSVVIDLEPAYEAMVGPLQSALASLPAAIAGTAGGDARLPLANVRPRLRMTALYFLANSLNYLVAGTGNRSELTVGYFTKHGDGGVDILPIGHLLKSDVTEIARELGVPQSVIDKPPSAGLWVGQTDEAEMGFRYADLERYLSDGPEGVSPAFALRLERLIRSTEHKRALPPDPSGTSF
jgi:NAD+ synthase